MKLRHRYLLVGIAWALLLAPVVTFAFTSFMLGAFWLYVFGDNPFPQWLDGFILITGSIVFLLTATTSIHLSRKYGRLRESSALGDAPEEHRRALFLGLLPVVLLALTALVVWQRAGDTAAGSAQLDNQIAEFNQLKADRHVLQELSVTDSNKEHFQIHLSTSGRLPRTYSLQWQVNAQPYGEVLSNERFVALTNDTPQQLSFEFTLAELAQSYRDQFLTAGNVVVDEAFTLSVTLIPVVDDKEIQAWPEFERFQWEQGKSALASTLTTIIHVSFRIDADGMVSHGYQ
jgi:hypothetical protein